MASKVKPGNEYFWHDVRVRVISRSFYNTDSWIVEGVNESYIERVYAKDLEPVRRVMYINMNGGIVKTASADLHLLGRKTPWSTGTTDIRKFVEVEDGE